MKMAHPDAPLLRDFLPHASAKQMFHDHASSFCLSDLRCGTSLSVPPNELTERSVLIATGSQFTAALALIELDGRARRLVLLPPDTDATQLDDILDKAEIDAVVIDEGTSQLPPLNIPGRVICRSQLVAAEQSSDDRRFTEWLLLTSGTTGAPKLVAHDLADLTAAIAAQSLADGALVWGTFYDIRRYGGLQMFLRAVLGGASFVFPALENRLADIWRG